MTRQELYNLVYQVSEAAKTLALAERDYTELNNKLVNELSDKYPMKGSDDASKRS